MSTEDNSQPEIQRLSDCEHVRKRPRMYIGWITRRGCHVLLDEVLQNSIDEVRQGFASLISVTLRTDGGVCVVDDGRGIPVQLDDPETERLGRSFYSLEGLLTDFRYLNPRTNKRRGLMASGVATVNFLSSEFEVEIGTEDKYCYQLFRKGQTVGEMKLTGPTDFRGMKVSFLPDTEIFSSPGFDYEEVRRRLVELAALTPEAKFDLVDERTSTTVPLNYEEGIVSLYDEVFPNTYAVNEERVCYRGQNDELEFKVVFGVREHTISFANEVRTPEGGSHVDAFQNAVVDALNDSLEQDCHTDEKAVVLLEDIKGLLTSVVSVRLPAPTFQGQTKEKFVNNNAGGFMYENLKAQFDGYFRDHPELVKSVRYKAKERINREKSVR